MKPNIGILLYDKGPDHLLSLSIYNEKYWAIILVSYDLQLNFLNKKLSLEHNFFHKRVLLKNMKNNWMIIIIHCTLYHPFLLFFLSNVVLVMTLEWWIEFYLDFLGVAFVYYFVYLAAAAASCAYNNFIIDSTLGFIHNSKYLVIPYLFLKMVGN